MKIEPTEFIVNGLTLRGNIYLADNSKSLAMLFIHGWTGLPNEPAAEILAKNGYSSMTFSLSGHNDSDGKLENQTRQRSLAEVLAAYDFFKSKLPADTKIGAAGNSYGGYLAVLLTAERPVACLQLRVPANYADEHFNEAQLGRGGDNSLVMEWRKQILGPTGTRALTAIHNFDGPIQIIEAENDERIPHQVVDNYLNAIENKSKIDYHLMKGWTHSLGPDEDRNKQYQNLLLKWLSEQL